MSEEKLKHVTSALKLFLLNFTSFFIIVANTRAYTQGFYMWTAVTDLMFCAMAFTITKKVSESKTKWDHLGYVLGGTIGAQASIYITKILYGA